MRVFSVPSTQPELQPAQPEGGGMLTSSFEVTKLHRIIYMNIYEMIELAMSCTHGRNLHIYL